MEYINRIFKEPVATVQEEADRNISFLEMPARNILAHYKEEILTKKYDSVIGDDAGGRLHSLLLGQCIKDLYGDEKRLPIIFVKGGRLLKKSNEHIKDVREYIELIKGKVGKKTLLISEEIIDGSSIQILKDILIGCGIEVDVAVFQVADDEMRSNEIITLSDGTEIFNGGGHGCVLDKKYSGVWDDEASKDGHSVLKGFSDERGDINAIRLSVKKLSHKLSSEFS